MDRRKFLKQTSYATLLLSSASALSVLSLGISDFAFADLDENDLEKISPGLQAKVNALFATLKEKKWVSYLNSEIAIPGGLKIPDLIKTLPTHKLKSLKAIKGFEDFAGNKLIEPGFPALSLLYHVLANPRVRPNGFTEGNYLSLEELDVLEDYIFALQKWSKYKDHYTISNEEELVLSVFAYEYRTAFKTPHHRHADFVYSRTGIARIGEEKERFDPENRCYTNNPSGLEDDSNIAVVPARYGLFIAKKAKIKEGLFSTMKMEKDKILKAKPNGNRVIEDIYYLKNDNDYDYLIPIRKIFDDDLLTNSSEITFNEKHESQKTAELFNPIRKDLIRTSSSLVNTIKKNSSILILSKKGKLIAPIVDPKTNGKLVFDAKSNSGNRYFTSYFNGGNRSNPEDIELYYSGSALRGLANNYDNPRNLPMYVNITHEIEKDSVMYKIRENNPNFENRLNNGKSLPVPLFQDNICDGYVSASINFQDSGKNQSSFLKKMPLNAFSIITAPDFFPQVDDFDLQAYDVNPGAAAKSLFYEGGISSLANCKMPPPPEVYQSTGPDSSLKTFNSVISVDKVKIIANDIDAQLIKKFSDPKSDKEYFFSSYLPDMCSSVFAPGWDVTYSGNEKTPYLSTRGLGSPFVEDMKLCAAMNGMWPAASPDASRTYQGSVTEEQTENWRRNPTAIPLLDIEIGLDSNSPAVKDHKLPTSQGWDGEHGPFLELTDSKWTINFTDLGRADYVETAINGHFDMSRLRKLTSKELNHRAACLRLCIDKLNQTDYPNGLNDLWLVSAEKVNWDSNALGQGIPLNLLTTDNKWATARQDGITGNGFLFVFASYKPNDEKNPVNWVDNGNQTKRRRVACQTIYVCQVSNDKVRHYSINLGKPLGYDPAKWS